jgi:twitching motility two-component system response regulator PilH
MSIRTVMVVDDSDTDRHFVTEILANAGYQVVAVTSAEAARARIREARPDLVLMDILMPGQDGYQAIRELTRSEETRDIPIFICSSKTSPSDRVWGLRQGARDYVTKPVQADDLLRKITALG